MRGCGHMLVCVGINMFCCMYNCVCACASVSVCVCECVGCVRIHVCVYTGKELNNDFPCLETVCIRISIILYYVHI